MSVGHGATPVIVLTGFLGSGKTTVLAHLLRDPRLTNSAVIVNEFGEVGLDHGLVEAIDQDVVLLPQGCICCTVNGDLSATLEGLSLRRETGDVPPFDRVIVETTGLADPAPVIGAILDRAMVLCGYRLGSVLTTVDSANAARTLARHPQARRQVAVADRLLLTKTDLVDATETSAALTELAHLNPHAPVNTVLQGELDPALLLSSDRDELTLPEAPHDRDATSGHTSHLKTLVIRFVRPVPYDALTNWLGRLVGEHGETLLRIKGVVALEGQTAPIAVHGVQHIFHPPRRLQAWPPGVTGTTIVMILDGLDPAVVRAEASACGLQLA